MLENTAPLVFVINSDQVFVNLIEQLLEDEGFRVQVWVDGTTAYKSVREAQPHLVILDLNVTNDDSALSVLDALTLDPETNDIPVIVASTNPKHFFEDIEHLRSHGCYLLPKPFDLDELLGIVRGAVD